jgi:hypothetical protein
MDDYNICNPTSFTVHAFSSKRFFVDTATRSENHIRLQLDRLIIRQSFMPGASQTKGWITRERQRFLGY